MKYKMILLVIFVTVLLVVIGAGSYSYTNNNPSLTKACPDEWIEDRMPTTEGDKSTKQYFIFNGERKEIKNYDVDWIKNNCSAQIEYVY